MSAISHLEMVTLFALHREGRLRSLSCDICGNLFVWLVMVCSSLVNQRAAADDLSTTPTMTTDYDYRGVSQTALRPAVQVGLDYTAKDMHAQIWASNVSFEDSDRIFGPSHTEVALDVDISRAISTDIRLIGGANFYYYPGGVDTTSYPEVFLAGNYRLFDLWLHYTPWYDGLSKRSAAVYIESNSNIPLPGVPCRVVLHLGGSFGNYWQYNNHGAYADFAVGLTTTFREIEVSLRYVGTRSYSNVARDSLLSGAGRAVLSISWKVAL